MQYFRNNDGCFIRADIFEQYKSQYILPNLKKLLAIRMDMWNARKLPDTINHYSPSKQYPGYVKVPSGISSFLVSKFDLQYANEAINHPLISRVSYDYQGNAVTSLLQRNVGLLHASTGSGKTQMICEIIFRLKRNTLVVVQNLTQMQQMVDDIQGLLSVTPIQVSGKKYSKKEQTGWYEHITVCSIDSRDKINPKDYGLILWDECDTFIGSDDRREWIGNCSAEYQYGMTGTIKVNNVDDNVFRLYYGITTELKLLHNTPDYVQVKSQFEYYLDDIKDFHELKAALYGSDQRNDLIISTLMKYIPGRKGIIFTEHVEHARGIYEECIRRGVKSFLLIGEVADDERERIRTEAKEYQGEVVIVGSVKILGRGFDLPELSFAILTTSEKFTSSIQQYLGRICRKHPTKPQPIFIDIVDPFTGILLNQAKSRLQTFKKTFPTGKITPYF